MLSLHRISKLNLLSPLNQPVFTKLSMGIELATLGTSLLENDIPGASLCGRKPSELKNEELKFWLKCRDDPAKGLKTKAELVKR